MEAIAIYNRRELRQAGQFSPSMMNDFVAWIDRSDKTTRSYLVNLRQFAAWLRYARITNPQRADVVAYRDWLVAEHDAIILDPASVTGWTYRTDSTGRRARITCKPNTVAQYLRSVCQFFKWTAANDLYPDVAANIHAPKITHDTHRKDALTVAEVAQIETSITDQARRRVEAAQDVQKDTAGRLQRSTEQGKRLYAMYLLAVNAGLRTVEISRARVKDFETKGGRSWLWVWGKGHTEADKKKPLAPEVAEAVRDYLRSRADRITGDSPLFVGTGNRSGGRAIATTTISTMLKQAMKEAGFDSERLTAHSLRHTAGTAVQELTGNLYLTQQYMRHSNPATTEIYLHNDTEQAEAGIAKQLYDLYHGHEQTGSREKLVQIMDRLTPQQLDRLASIAEALA